MRIWKYNLSKRVYQLVKMPKNSQVLTAQLQHDQIVLWALVNPDEPRMERCFYAAYTGEKLEGEVTAYYGTIQDSDGLVYHIVEFAR